MASIITKVVTGVTAERTDYISRANLNQALEGHQRGLYGEVLNDLKRTKAANYLRGENRVNGAFDLIVSSGDGGVFEQLGETSEERRANLKSAVRASLAELEESLELKLRWVAAEHQNTKHHHLHILVSEEATRPDGTIKRLRWLPRALVTREANGNTVLSNIFLRQIEERIQVAPESMPTRRDAALEARYPLNATLENAAGLRNYLTISKGLVPSVVKAAVDNGALRASEESNPVYVRRDAEGLTTGAIWQETGENYLRRVGSGWFYQGNLQTAKTLPVSRFPGGGFGFAQPPRQTRIRRYCHYRVESRRPG